jgi:AAA domain, putative AbiEii toxin, Type IV TA system
MADIRLESLRYSEWLGQPLEWTFDGLVLGQLNLLVGKNATGKSRALNVIGCLARVLSNEQKALSSGTFDATFRVGGESLRYILAFDGEKVVKEQVFVGDEAAPKLDRTETVLSIYLEKKDEFIEYEPPATEISAVSRKDVKQHSFLLPLHDWAVAVRHYHFGSQLGKDKILMAVRKRGKPSDFNEDRDEERVVAVFRKGQKEFGAAFTDAIIADMNELGYSVTEVDTLRPDGVSFQTEPPIPLDADLLVLGVVEDGIGGMYSQISMSQGMFRALSIIAQINYSQLSGRATCILVDDIGEGLDFDRSALLIELLRRKAKASEFQLTMSTNDQFVMNHVPLEEWSILQRAGNRVTVRNIHNSKSVFENFKFVGMSNFAFFEMDFANAESEASRQLTLEGLHEHE